jgi:hypothetical protein
MRSVVDVDATLDVGYILGNTYSCALRISSLFFCIAFFF